MSVQYSRDSNSWTAAAALDSVIQTAFEVLNKRDSELFDN